MPQICNLWTGKNENIHEKTGETSSYLHLHTKYCNNSNQLRLITDKIDTVFKNIDLKKNPDIKKYHRSRQQFKY